MKLKFRFLFYNFRTLFFCNFTLSIFDRIVFDARNDVGPKIRVDLQGESLFDSTLDGTLSWGHFVTPQAEKNPLEALV